MRLDDINLLDRDVFANGVPHEWFGGGPHICLGASLARMELRVLFEELARRVPVLRALGAPVPLRSNIVAGIKHLPVDLGAASARSD